MCGWGVWCSTQYYKGQTRKGSHYIEVDIDVGSSSVATSVVNLALGATKSLSVDMAILLQVGYGLPHILNT